MNTQHATRNTQHAVLCVILGAGVAGCLADQSVSEINDSQASTQALTTAASDDAPHLITVASTPHTACTLYAPSGESMSIWSDDEGIVRLRAPRLRSPEDYTLTCDEPAGQVTYHLDLSAPSTFAPATPRATAKRTIRPGLVDPQALSQDELVAAGYPPRPSAGTDGYDLWLKAVTTDSIVVEPHFIERTDLSFGPEVKTTSQRWSGFALNRAGGRYSAVVGVLVVPSFIPVSPDSNAAFWAGLDGVPANSDIIQDGVFYNSVGVSDSYRLWVEYFPNAPMFLTTPAVGANDQIFLEAWEGNSLCQFGLFSGIGTGCFYLKNLTTGQDTGVAPIAISAPNMNFTGATCDAVVERQVDTRLAKWEGIVQFEFGCYDLLGNWYNATSEPYLNFSMVNRFNNKLATAVQTGPQTVGIDWLRGL